ncbi:hypothetical protein J6590_062923 [Homalodisca vitripennis]|nr:hypothetical protein J6590_062923 [Homalodisca vitripennis]
MVPLLLHPRELIYTCYYRVPVNLSVDELTRYLTLGKSMFKPHCTTNDINNYDQYRGFIRQISWGGGFKTPHRQQEETRDGRGSLT